MLLLRCFHLRCFYPSLYILVILVIQCHGVFCVVEELSAGLCYLPACTVAAPQAIHMRQYSCQKQTGTLYWSKSATGRAAQG